MIYAFNMSGGVETGYLNDLYYKRGELQLMAVRCSRSRSRRAATVTRASRGEIERSAKVDGLCFWESSRQSHYGYVENKTIEASALSSRRWLKFAQSGVLPKAARWLVASRRYGDRWDSTKDTAFAIYGLTDYLKASRELQPDYTVEVYLNGAQVMTRRMTAQDATSGQPFIIEQKGGEVAGNNEVRVVKRGRGALYLSANLVYYTAATTPPRTGHQLKMTR